MSFATVLCSALKVNTIQVFQHSLLMHKLSSVKKRHLYIASDMADCTDAQADMAVHFSYTYALLL